MVLCGASSRRSAMLLSARDTDRMYHRIGPIGNGLMRKCRACQPRAKIQPDGDGNWIILENEEVRATYPSHAIRFSVLWKAEFGTENRAPTI